MTKAIAFDGLPLDPTRARYVSDKRLHHPDWWYYEERGGISVVNAAAGTCWIPISNLRAYIKRHDAALEDE